MKRTKTRAEAEQEFSQHTTNGPNGCLNWIGSKHPEGYGYLCFERKTWLVHRMAWEMANGPIPDGLLVLHKCDNRLCVNPDHLFLGTHQDNADDREAKGRGTHPPRLKGEAHGQSKLTDKQVREIKDLRWAVSLEKLAKRFGVSKSAINLIHHGKTWTHVDSSA